MTETTKTAELNLWPYPSRGLCLCRADCPHTEPAVTDQDRILVECAVEFGRHTTRPLGTGAPEELVRLFARTVMHGFEHGVVWNAAHRLMVLHVVKAFARDVERACVAFDEDYITCARLGASFGETFDRSRAAVERARRRQQAASA